MAKTNSPKASHKLNVSLAELLAWAHDNDMDATDVQAIKDAYRKDRAGTEDKEARSYNKKNVTLYIHLPNGETLHFFDLHNSKSQLLTKAHFEAVKAIADYAKGKKNINQKELLSKVSVTWGETVKLSEELSKTSL